MEAYLAQLAGGRRRAREVGQSLELLRRGLDGYGYQNLSRADRDRWSAARRYRIVQARSSRGRGGAG